MSKRKRPRKVHYVRDFMLLTNEDGSVRFGCGVEGRLTQGFPAISYWNFCGFPDKLFTNNENDVTCLRCLRWIEIREAFNRHQSKVKG
jgi:hypothetical protein